MIVCSSIGMLLFIIIGFILYCIIVSGSIRNKEIDMSKLFDEDTKKE